MRARACQYAILRFVPDPETGEFANIGVVIACTEHGFIDAILLSSDETGRIANFFGTHESEVVRAVIDDLEREIERAKGWIAERRYPDNFTMVRQVFDELTRPRETILRCSEIRVVLSCDPATTLLELYARLVRPFNRSPIQSSGVPHRLSS